VGIKSFLKRVGDRAPVPTGEPFLGLDSERRLLSEAIDKLDNSIEIVREIQAKMEEALKILRSKPRTWTHP
jgi:hypothetical protein